MDTILRANRDALAFALVRRHVAAASVVAAFARRHDVVEAVRASLADRDDVVESHSLKSKPLRTPVASLPA